MSLFENATIYVAESTTVKNSEGTKIKSFDFENPLEEFKADVQPNSLTLEQMQLYGISSKTAETKKCFFKSARFMNPGNRAKVVFEDGSIKIYDIQPVNKWRFHSEVLLIPVEN